MEIKIELEDLVLSQTLLMTEVILGDAPVKFIQGAFADQMEMINDIGQEDYIIDFMERLKKMKSDLGL
jgi:hypothetical protein